MSSTTPPTTSPDSVSAAGRLADRVDTSGLQALDGFSFPALASPGARAQAVMVAERCQRALDWLARVFDERPSFTLIVAGRRDWPRVALVPLYGMPHAFPGLIVTGAEPPSFWHEYVRTLLRDLSPDERQTLTTVYGDPPRLDERFADLVVVHELTHLFHAYDERTGMTDFPRLWLAELFANIGLHGYVAENEPDQLAVLQTICRLTWDAPAARWPVRDLGRIEASLATGPLNYVWFQLRLIVVAEAIWQGGGPAGMRAFREALTTGDATDARIVETIDGIAPVAAEAIRSWPA
jgi:hypothetical protein